jgi:hypothetical protein
MATWIRDRLLSPVPFVFAFTLLERVVRSTCWRPLVAERPDSRGFLKRFPLPRLNVPCWDFNLFGEDSLSYSQWRWLLLQCERAGQQSLLARRSCTLSISRV